MKYELVQVDGDKWAVRRCTTRATENSITHHYEYYSPALACFPMSIPEGWWHSPDVVRRRSLLTEKEATKYYEHFLKEEYNKRPLEVKVVRSSAEIQ